MKSQINKLISIFACVCLLLTALVVPTFAADGTASYVKVTEAPADWSGDYLIVYEDENMIFDGSLTTLDAVNDYKAVTINNGVIAAEDKTNAAKFTITKSGDNYTIKSASGYFIGQTSNANGLKSSTSDTYNNTISINDDDTVNIISGGAYLRFNTTSGQDRFRYYKSSSYTGQKAIALYKLEVATEEEPSCEHIATTPVPNGDETHNIVCNDCGEPVTEAVGCTDDDANGKCDVCDGDVALSCEHTTTATEPNGDETHKVVCDDCSKTVTPVVDCTDDDANGKCDVCDGDVTLSDDGGDEGDDTTPTYAIVDTAVVGTAYKFGLVQGNLNKTLYLNGDMDGHYMATTEKVTEAVDVYLEETDGGYHLYAMVSGAKKYMNIVVDGTYTNVKFEDTASSVYTYNSAKGVYETTAGTSQRAFGTDSRYKYYTISAVVTQYDQFFCKFYAATTSEGGNEGGEVTPPAGGDEGGEVTPPAGGDEGGEVTPPTGGGQEPTDPPAGGETADNAEISFEDAANRTTSTETQQVWTENGVTVTYDKNTYNNNLAEYDNPARFYKGTSVIIAYPGMTGIVIKAANNYVTAWSESIDASLATATVDGTTVIIALNEAADTFSFASMSAQGRAYTITVYTGEFNADDFIDSTPAFDPAGKTAAEIVDAAYALESGAAFESNATLTGEIVNIDTPYSEQHGNITVTIKVDGADANKTIMCYRLKGEGADTLAVGDKITVTGIIKNYNGTIEFDAGCTFDNLVKGEGEVPTAPEDPKEIVDAAFALEEGKTLPYSATLTGKITNIEKINEQYGDVCLTIAVEGSDGEKELYCYNLKPTEGIDLATLAVGDVITVTGNLKNYNGTIEFISCSFEFANTDSDEENGGETDDDTTGGTTGDTTGDTTTDTDDNGATNDTTSPVTGDNVGAIAMVSIAAAAVILYTNKKR